MADHLDYTCFRVGKIITLRVATACDHAALERVVTRSNVNISQRVGYKVRRIYFLSVNKGLATRQPVTE